MTTNSKLRSLLFILTVFLLPACDSTTAPVLPEPGQVTAVYIYTDG